MDSQENGEHKIKHWNVFHVIVGGDHVHFSLSCDGATAGSLCLRHIEFLEFTKRMGIEIPDEVPKAPNPNALDMIIEQLEKGKELTFKTREGEFHIPDNSQHLIEKIKTEELSLVAFFQKYGKFTKN